MLNDEISQRQEKLENYIRDMSSSCMEDSALKKMVIKLETLYTGGFRHNYSGFFPIIVEVSKDNKDNLDFLSNNLDAIKNIIEENYIKEGKKEPSDADRCIYKLSDHINLEIARYNYYSISGDDYETLKKKNKALQDSLGESIDKLGKMNEELEKIRTDVIAVLSIFSAVVLTFSGSLSLFGSALKGMERAPLFKSAFFVILCGFIVMNIIFFLMYFVGKLTGRKLFESNSNNSDDGKKEKGKCFLCRLKRDLPYVFWMNLTLIVLMFSDLIFLVLNSIFNWLPL